MDVTVEPLTHPDALSAEDQRAYAAVLNAAWSAWNPDHVPWTVAAALARARVHAPPSVVRYLVARDPDGSLVGVGQLHWRDDAPGGCVARIFVAPSHRGRGIARAVGARLVEVGRRAGRTGVTAEVADRDAGLARVLERHGFRRDLPIELNAVSMTEIDGDLLRRWAARGEATPGYSLVAYDAPAPEGLIEALVAVRHVMNTAPLREGEPEEHYTVGELRAFEAAVAAAEQDWWAVAARHDATGELVGLSELYLPRLEPHLALQGDTGVHPDHRGRGLGAWMKAVNHLRLAIERPEVRVVHTWNAATNAPMLRINRDLGYRTVLTLRSWYRPLG